MKCSVTEVLPFKARPFTDFAIGTLVAFTTPSMHCLSPALIVFVNAKGKLLISLASPTHSWFEGSDNPPFVHPLFPGTEITLTATGSDALRQSATVLLDIHRNDRP